MDHLSAQGEFSVIRHDGTYKSLMSLTGQPKHGAKIRSIRGAEVDCG